MSKKIDDKKNVVIVGGGFSAVHLINALKKKLDRTKYDIVVVSSRPYHAHLPAMIRLLVSDIDNLQKNAFIPFDKQPVTFRQGTVASIEEEAPGQGGHVVLKDGDTIPYHVLVLATGMSWNGLANIGESDQEIRANIGEWQRRFAAANDIVIAGGGAVGIELSGEIKDIYPNKKVTIIHNDRLLLNSAYPDKYRKDIEKRARGRGVEIVFGDKVDPIPEYGTIGVTTRNGKSLPQVDLVVPTFGSRPNTEFIYSLGPDVLTQRGTVKINPTLELPAHPGVFAIGDIIDWEEQKQAAKVMSHAPIVSANILSFLAGTPLKKLYKGSSEMIIVPVGKEYGSAYLGILWGIVLGNWFSKMIKGRDLLVSRARASLGYN